MAITHEKYWSLIYKRKEHVKTGYILSNDPKSQKKRKIRRKKKIHSKKFNKK